jgi:secreted trypsin-like serine protease
VPAERTENDVLEGDSQLPFERYREGGRELLGRPAIGDGSCRRGYGPPVFTECGMECVYCDRDLGESYESWLHLSVDHVIPYETVNRLGWPGEWVEGLSNLVTSAAHATSS